MYPNLPIPIDPSLQKPMQMDPSRRQMDQRYHPNLMVRWFDSN